MVYKFLYQDHDEESNSEMPAIEYEWHGPPQ